MNLIREPRVCGTEPRHVTQLRERIENSRKAEEPFIDGDISPLRHEGSVSLQKQPALKQATQGQIIPFRPRPI